MRNFNIIIATLLVLIGAVLGTAVIACLEWHGIQITENW